MGGLSLEYFLFDNCRILLENGTQYHTQIDKILESFRDKEIYCYGGPKCSVQNGGENSYTFVGLTIQCADQIEIEPNKSLQDFYEENRIECYYKKSPCLILRNTRSKAIEIYQIDRRLRVILNDKCIM